MTRFAPSLTRRAAIRVVEDLLAAAGLPEAEADARILVEEATGLDRSALVLSSETALGAEAAATLEAYAQRRLAREPVFRIAGRRQFWGLDLLVTPDVLDPRPDTETVVTAALAAWAGRPAPLRLLDLGTGSGALLCALLSEWPAARGLGVDRSAAACAVARRNLASCGLAARAEVVESDWTAGLAGPFDLVVSNPPYIASAAIPRLDPEVRDHDPILALDGGDDGLQAYRALCRQVPAVLAIDGLFVVEVGSTQAGDVAALMAKNGLTLLQIARDLGGHERAVVGSRAAA